MSRYPERWADLDVTLCHDWLTGMRGGERVLEMLCEGFPRAPVYTLIHNPAAISGPILSHPIHTSRLQSMPGVFRSYRNFLAFMPHAIESMRLPQSDLLVSTSHCVAKGARPPAGTRHLCYCFTPMRYAWLFYHEYFGDNPAKALVLKPLLAWLRRWDRRSSARVHRFVAISRHVQDRIRRFYGRESDLVYPPVDTARFHPSHEGPEDFDLVVSALVPYKRIDLAVEAYNRLGRPLKIVGVGGSRPALEARAGAHITFLGWQSDEVVHDLYRRCRMLVFPGEEDFGIVPVEAQASGRPVVALGRGGATETVAPGISGVLFDEQTPEALAAAVSACAAARWDTAAILAQAQRFDVRHFIAGMAASIDDCLNRDPL